MIFLDSSIVIQMVERSQQERDRLKHFMAGLDVSGPFRCSELAWLECLVKPRREQNTELEHRYQSLFENRIPLVPINSQHVQGALEIRAIHSFSTPDAIHLAAAIESDAKVFITSDKQLERFTDLPIKLFTPNPETLT